MQDHLIQKRLLLNKKEFTLGEKGVELNERSFLSSRRLIVPYENISDDEPFEVSVSSKYAFWFFVGLLSSGLVIWLISLNDSRIQNGAYFFYLILAIPFGIWFFLSRVTYVGLHCNQQTLLFYKNNPSQETLNDFLQILRQKKMNYMRANYIEVGNMSIAGELERLGTLKAQGIISEDEFDRLKRAIINRDTYSGGNIGFRN